MLFHGFPFDIHSHVEVIPMLTDAGLRVIVASLHGHGATRFADPATPDRVSGPPLAPDVMESMDALAIDRAGLTGFDWSGRAACVAAALYPQDAQAS